MRGRYLLSTVGSYYPLWEFCTTYFDVHIKEVDDDEFGPFFAFQFGAESLQRRLVRWLPLSIKMSALILDIISAGKVF